MSTARAGLPNLHGLAICGQPLCVECRGCGRRAAVPLDRVHAFRGNMQQIVDLRLVCSACSSRDVAGYMMVRPAEVDAFLAGEPPSDWSRTDR